MAITGHKTLPCISVTTSLPFGRLHADAPPETAQWGKLAGVWDCTLPGVGDGEDGRAWTWDYTIGGHAVRDLYVGHGEGGPSFHGNGLRVYNPIANAWEIAWIDTGPISTEEPRRVKLFRATYEKDQIVMRQVDGDPRWRTVFYNIRENTFEWRNEPSEQRMHCQRKRR